MERRRPRQGKFEVEAGTLGGYSRGKKNPANKKFVS